MTPAEIATAAANIYPYADHTYFTTVSAATLNLDPDELFRYGYPSQVVGFVTGTASISTLTAPVPGDPLNMVLLVFEDSCTLTHSANLSLLDTTSYTTSPGDILAFAVNGAPTKWREVFRVLGGGLAELIENLSHAPEVVAAASTLPLDTYSGNSFPGRRYYAIEGTASISMIPHSCDGSRYMGFFRVDDGCTFVHSDRLALPGGVNYIATAGTIVVLAPANNKRNNWTCVFAWDGSSVTYTGLSAIGLQGFAGASGVSVPGGDSSLYGIATQAEAEAGISNTKLMTPLRVAEAIEAQAATGAAETGGLLYAFTTYA
jgi:hypothetical protein